MASLLDLKNSLRFRLGEIEGGTWTTETYKNSVSDATGTEIDELKMLLNEAQVSVLRDIFTHQWIPFRRLNDTIPIVPLQTNYTLPVEYIQMVDIYHHKGNQTPIRLEPRVLSQYRQLNPNIRNSGSGSSGQYFEFYEVSGQTGLIVAEGVVTWQINDINFSAENTDLTGVRVGDLITNLTDNSQAVITDIGSSVETADGFFGGRSNRMQTGDEFIIHSREESRFNLEVWPPIEFASSKLTYTPDNTDDNKIQLRTNNDGVIKTIRVNFKMSLFQSGGPLENYESHERLLIYIKNITTDETIDILGFQRAMAGWNQLEIVNSRLDDTQGYTQFTVDNLYEMYIVHADDVDTPLALDFSLTGTSTIELIQQSEEYLSVSFVKRAAPFIIDQSICELPEEFHEALVEKAALTALRKTNNGIVNQSLLSYYKIIINDAKTFLMNRQEPYSHTIDSEEGGTFTHTPGFSAYNWFSAYN